MAGELHHGDADDELKQAVKKVLDDLGALNQDLATRHVPEEQGWFRNILVGISNFQQFGLR